ncbi:hypothetical protein SCHPADRAFT_890084 [Schizopora paradoxa]|uniref:Uncharacterized protein n=1 Tax=Schizopora paradoxa TaxID=27342 RepID=A0A0H2RN53_9AGAM|nr:hypothetical protein SCHPADRAFT_890084 [Schizopora paradoxa]
MQFVDRLLPWRMRAVRANWELSIFSRVQFREYCQWMDSGSSMVFSKKLVSSVELLNGKIVWYGHTGRALYKHTIGRSWLVKFTDIVRRIGGNHQLVGDSSELEVHNIRATCDRSEKGTKYISMTKYWCTYLSEEPDIATSDAYGYRSHLQTVVGHHHRLPAFEVIATGQSFAV